MGGNFNNMEHLREQNGIILYEYFCPVCQHFFWISRDPIEQLTCPFCGERALLNGELPIKEIEFEKEQNENYV